MDDAEACAVIVEDELTALEVRRPSPPSGISVNEVSTSEVLRRSILTVSAGKA